jgi:hypothetical protein
LSKAAHRDTDGNATPEAFLLRPSDNGRLSVFRRKMASVEQARSVLKKTYGAASLHTGRIRSINNTHPRRIDVVAAEGEGTDIPGHAAISNLPDPKADEATAERIASLLRDQSRRIVDAPSP